MPTLGDFLSGKVRNPYLENSNELDAIDAEIGRKYVELHSLKRKAGRPREPEAEKIHQLWIELGKPSLYADALAEAYLGVGFETATPSERKRQSDRLRSAVNRVERRIQLN